MLECHIGIHHRPLCYLLFYRPVKKILENKMNISWLFKILIGIIRFYQWTLSPILGVNKCRYYPSCSHYMIEAIQIHGLKGLWFGIKRILRCQPWGGCGFDPVPDKEKNL